MKLDWKRLWGFLLALFLLAASGSATASAKEETVVRFGVFPSQGFCDISTPLNPRGYIIDYINAVCARTGWKAEFVYYSSWERTLHGLEGGQIDVMAPAQMNDERLEAQTFDSFPIGTEYGALLANSDNTALVYEDYRAFDGLTVGCVRGSAFENEFQTFAAQHDFQVRYVFFEDTLSLLSALRAGEIDAAVANLMNWSSSEKILAKFGASPFYFAVRTGSGDLLNQLNAALDQLTTQFPQFQQELNERYFSQFTTTPFSRAELDYMSRLGTLKVGCPMDCAPYSYLNEETGQIEGVDRKILDRIGQITGLKFEYVPLTPAENNTGSLQKHGIRIAAGTRIFFLGSENGEQQVTNPYLNITEFFAGCSGTYFDADVQMRVAVVNVSAQVLRGLKKQYPNFTFESDSTMEECARRARSGAVDLILQDRYSLDRFLTSPHNSDFVLMPTEGVSTSLCFSLVEEGDGVSTADPDSVSLGSVLNKAISQIDSGEIDQYLTASVSETQYRYSAGDFVYQYRYPLIVASVSVLLCLCAILITLLERRRGQRLVADNELKLRNITDNINGGVAVLRIDEKLDIVYVNDGFLTLIGCTRAQFETREDRSCSHFLLPEDFAKIRAAAASQEESNQISLELRILRQDGRYIQTLFNGTAARRQNGERQLYCVIMDMTQQASMMEQLQIDKVRTQLILEKANEIFYEMDLTAKTVITSNSLRRKMGWSFPERPQQFTAESMIGMSHVFSEDEEILRKATREMLAHKSDVRCTVRLQKSDGSMLWCEINQCPILSGSGEMVSVVGLLKDVDQIFREREKLQNMAQRDPLTGLYNKETFETIVSRYLVSSSEEGYALLFLDLDHFKSVNDQLGHLTGDRAIRDAAQKLQLIFSNYDVLCRFGGDEFCVFIRNIPLKTLEDKLEWLLQKMRQDYWYGTKLVHVTSSVGVFYRENGGGTYVQMLTAADRALYQAKASGRDRYLICRD